MTREVTYVPSSLFSIAYTKIDHTGMGFEGDELPVLAARVSHGADERTGKDTAADLKLMKYLGKHNHTSPFEHQSVTFKVVCPIFVTREWMRHRTQSFNEISMRYTDKTIGDFWKPQTWRLQATKNKQSSEGELSPKNSAAAYEILHEAYECSLIAYFGLLDLGVCREQARAVIPVGHTTEFYATANLLNWSKFCKLRMAEDAQVEIRELAETVYGFISEIYPNSWSAING